MVVLGLLCAAGAARAQVVETPVAFDPAGRVTVVTPAIVEQFRLQAPTWPVSGVFAEARLFRQGSGGYVLVVTRPSGVTERYAVLDEQREALRSVMAGGAAAPASTPAASTPAASTPTPAYAAQSTSPRVMPPVTAEDLRRRDEQRARNNFLGAQILIGSALYSPLLAASVQDATDDEAVSSLALLGAVGASVFSSLYVAQHSEMTRARTFASAHAALHGAGAGATIVYLAAEDDADPNAYRLAAVAGGMLGSSAAFRLARATSESEAVAAGVAADAGIVGAYLLTAKEEADGDWDTEIDRGRAGMMLGSMAAGYALGALYPRAASYSVSPGDVTTLAVSGAVGMLAGGAVVYKNFEPRTAGAILFGSMLGGMALGDRFLVRDYDHSHGQAGILAAAAAGGAYALASIPGVADSDNGDPGRRALVFGTIGAVGGMVLVERALRLSRPAGEERSGVRRQGRDDAARAAQREPRLQVFPAGVALAAAGARAPQPVMRLTF